MAKYNFPVIIEKDEDGFYIASCPIIQGCYTQAKTYKEAMKRIQEAIELHLEARNIKIDFVSQDKLRV